MAAQPEPKLVQWLDYLTAFPPMCPTKSSSLQLGVEDTHQAGKSSVELCPTPLIIVKQTVISREKSAAILKYLTQADMKVPFWSAECSQALYNEQGVACVFPNMLSVHNMVFTYVFPSEVFFYNVLVPVKNALALVLKNHWAYSGIEQEVKYKIEIRAQQINTTGAFIALHILRASIYGPTDKGRCDHYIVLEPVIMNQGENVVPPKEKTWVSVNEFCTQMGERQKAMRSGGKSGFDYPSMVLCVIEEKVDANVLENVWKILISSLYVNRNPMLSTLMLG